MNRGIRMALAGALSALALLVLLALVSYAPDQIGGASSVGANLIGPAGAWLAHHIIGSWGLAGFIIPVFMVMLGLTMLPEDGAQHAPRRLTGMVLLVPILAGLVHLMSGDGFGQSLMLRWDMQRLHGLGGNMGWSLVGPIGPIEKPNFPGGLLRRHVDVGGSALILLIAAAGCVALIQVHLLTTLRRTARAVKSYRPHGDSAATRDRRLTTTPPPRDATPVRNRVVPPPAPVSPISQADRERSATNMKELVRRIQDDDAVPADAADLVERIRRRREALAQGLDPNAVDPVPPARATSADEPVRAPAAPPYAAQSGASSQPGSAPMTTIDRTPPSVSALPPSEAVVETPFVEPSEQSGRAPAAAFASATPAPKPKPRQKVIDSSGYNLPPVDLLDHVPMRDDARHEQEKTTTARAIEEVFSNFGIKVTVVAASRGPVITMYEIQLQESSMRVQKVEGFEKDLQLNLGTEGIRIVAPLPNKKTIGIEVPNQVKVSVVMRDLVEQTDASSMTLPLILGRDVVGAPIFGDLAKMPHLLVAGATGTGKSVCMNSMICSVLLFRGPDEVKFIMVDPKMVELAGYEDIPHLLTPPITDMTKAHAALEWACRTMDERYFALRLVGVRDIKAYNEMGEGEIRNRLARKGKMLEDLPGLELRMPYIIVLVDEYADLMMVNKEVEKSIIRLTQKSRAAGIHVILTTQRPSADVVTGLIKSNLPARICFRVADKSNSRVVLDSGGAENLLGRGDMLYLPPGTNTLVRGQGVWVKDSEIEAIIEHAKSQGSPQYDDTITSAGAVAMIGGSGGGGGKGTEWLSDRTFHEAVQSMYRYGRSGADFFRRKLNVGYNKATGYVEQLEDLGFVGPQKGTSPREILRSWDDWIELLKGQGLTWDEEDELYHDPNGMAGGIGRG